MKLLMIYAQRFGYQANLKTLEWADTDPAEGNIDDALVGFVQVEQEDEGDGGRVETKLIKNLKWAAKKNNTNKIVLHSFAHLSESKAAPEFTRDLLRSAENRLANADYEVLQTPFGYFLNLDLTAPGTSLARIFKSI